MNFSQQTASPQHLTIIITVRTVKTVLTVKKALFEGAFILNVVKKNYDWRFIEKKKNIIILYPELRWHLKVTALKTVFLYQEKFPLKTKF